ncbi:hypothetical protein N7497_001832 [Penicillium chrysogenum]|uniref:RNase H type-1 domain-containing protein n=1 Tax=Penicillium chrysogenum TaxID=5076 RepID=A0ABQ8WVE4_PENCH|nr:hypothetical protein N7505_000985 [Penicillium chrysogenum]KAJ6168989.1 hypothetical protein N7497_001832 [Penicillium chrysogenum]
MKEKKDKVKNATNKDRRTIRYLWTIGHGKSSPGHTGIEGNEAADILADHGALHGLQGSGPQALPTISGIRSVYRDLRNEARHEWWQKVSPKLSTWYQRWQGVYEIKDLPELDLRRPTLHR